MAYKEYDMTVYYLKEFYSSFIRMPVSRIRCKPGPDGTGSHSSNHLIAATYVSGYLRIWNYDNGLCVGQVLVYVPLQNGYFRLLTIALDLYNTFFFSVRMLSILK